ncbi:TonB-dependent receptor [Caldimonas sp.]|uniref:TonB-dependent receptor n=1 Tax=Caldimonas sp. TaxID=2838790 RepID=UPI0039191C82
MRLPSITAGLALTLLGVASAQPGTSLEPIEVKGHYDNAVGTSDAASQGTIRRELLDSRPALRPGEVLEYVPGMIVTQHSGDGKANQYFLRGFNLDHGTDFATWVDGMPANMPSHGHGQGYTDLNFIMPELIEQIRYRKGPYWATIGDFGSAGAAEMVYRSALERPFVQVTLGERAYRRVVFGGSTALQTDTVLLAGLELAGNDGPWVVEQDLRKLNGVLRWTAGSRVRGWAITAMAYDARWNATDQVPVRAIESGVISRFGAIDPTDGGRSARYSMSGTWHDRWAEGGISLGTYAMHYELGLYSNFTYAMDRPTEGDQFEQRDDRDVFGFTASRDWVHRLGAFDATTEVGLQWRHDRIRVGLYDTVARRRTTTTREDRVRQHNLGLYAENRVQWAPWLRSVAGLRAEVFEARVDSDLVDNSGRTSDHQWSPKLALVLGPWTNTEFFVSAGRGFHSNDARGTTTRVDPRSGDPADMVPALVASRGHEVGVRTEALPGLQSSLSVWWLKMGSELVYVGDAGTTEATRPSRRRGIEWNNRWTPSSWLLFDADLAWTHARYADASPDVNRIPGAVERVASVAATLTQAAGWSASLQWRYLGARPLIEDNSVRSRSTLLTNLRIARQLTPRLGVTLDVFNLLDRRVNDIEYFYESQLPGETTPVADRHVHPAEPRTVRLTLKASF